MHRNYQIRRTGRPSHLVSKSGSAPAARSSPPGPRPTTQDPSGDPRAAFRRGGQGVRDRDSRIRETGIDPRRLVIAGRGFGRHGRPLPPLVHLSHPPLPTSRASRAGRALRGRHGGGVGGAIAPPPTIEIQRRPPRRRLEDVGVLRRLTCPPPPPWPRARPLFLDLDTAGRHHRSAG